MLTAVYDDRLQVSSVLCSTDRENDVADLLSGLDVARRLGLSRELLLVSRAEVSGTKKPAAQAVLRSGSDGTRTRDLRRDRPAF